MAIPTSPKEKRKNDELRIVHGLVTRYGPQSVASATRLMEHFPGTLKIFFFKLRIAINELRIFTRLWEIWKCKSTQ